MARTVNERLAGEIAAAASSETISRRLALATRMIGGRVVFTTSFGLEDQAITHAICSNELRIEIVTLDTGRLFPETYDVWAETEARYGVRIAALAPDRDRLERLIARDGVNGFRSSIEARQACCGVRKVEPLGRALAGASGWVTGLRAEQSGERARTPLAAFDGLRRLVKVNPLADWTRHDVEVYVAENAIPYNALHERGFPSIGCAPCTRAVRLGEPERAGRWWWEQEVKKECGLHVRSTPVRAPEPAVQDRLETA